MIRKPDFILEPLSAHHDRQRFRCGNPALDTYLSKQAGQDGKRGISRTFIAIDAADEGLGILPIAGYYTLSSLSIDVSQLPLAAARRLPRHPIPAALIGRLTVAQTQQNRGLGGLLLADAVQRTHAASAHIGIHALVVDAIDDKAYAFYRKFGFIPLEHAGRLFLVLNR